MVYIQEWVSTELAGGWDGANAGSCHEAPILRLPDGRCWSLGGNPVAWFEPLAAMGRDDLLDDPRFADAIDREASKSELIELVAEWAGKFARFDDFRDELETKSLFTVAELCSIEDLAGSPWAEHREAFTETSVGVRVPTRPALGAEIGTSGPYGPRGADNRAILTEVLGLGDERLDALTAAGALTADV